MNDNITQLQTACRLYKAALEQARDCCGCGQGAYLEHVADAVASGDPTVIEQCAESLRDQPYYIPATDALAELGAALGGEE